VDYKQDLAGHRESKMRSGKLYKCPKYFLFIYPSKEKAGLAIVSEPPRPGSVGLVPTSAAGSPANGEPRAAAQFSRSVVAWWSKKAKLQSSLRRTW